MVLVLLRENEQLLISAFFSFFFQNESEHIRKQGKYICQVLYMHAFYVVSNLIEKRTHTQSLIKDQKPNCIVTCTPSENRDPLAESLTAAATAARRFLTTPTIPALTAEERATASPAAIATVTPAVATVTPAAATAAAGAAAAEGDTAATETSTTRLSTKTSASAS
jgi:hypothetical protein